MGAQNVIEPSKKQVPRVPVAAPSVSPPPPPCPSSSIPSVEDIYADMPPLVRISNEPTDEMPLLVSIDSIPTYPSSDEVFTHFVNMFENITCTETKCNDRHYIKYDSIHGQLNIVVYTIEDTYFISLNESSVELDVFNQIANLEYVLVDDISSTNVVFKNETSINVSCPMNILIRALSDNLYNVKEEELVQEETEEEEITEETTEELQNKNSVLHKSLVYLVSFAMMAMSLAVPYNSKN
jgi:hypothetical protein